MRAFIAAVALVLASLTGAAKALQVQDMAILYIFNDSGPTLFGGNQKVKEHGGPTLVSLPRHTYQRIEITAGRHELRLPSLRRPHIILDAVAGESYYVVVAYKPERSYFFPLAGQPYVLEQITAEQAQELFAKMTERTKSADNVR